MLSGGRRQADYGSRTVLRTKSSHFRGHTGAAQAQGSSQSHLSYTGLEKGSAKPPLCTGGKEGTERWEKEINAGNQRMVGPFANILSQASF